MSQNIRLTLLTCVMLQYVGNLLNAVSIDTGFAITNVYQHEELKRSDVLYFTPGEASITDKVSVDNINLWQFGMKGQIAPPKDHFYWNNNRLLSALNNFYFEGFGYYGWGGWGANLSEHINNLTNGNVTKGRATLSHVNTFDLQGGLGYLFSWGSWGLGISSGYGYDTQEIKSKHGTLTLPNGDTIDAALYHAGYKTKTIWKGPYLGGQLFYEFCNWRFGLGYEYHWALFTCNHYLYNSAESQSEGFEEETHSDDAYGNVVFCNAYVDFWDGWVAGASFKYQNWQARNGRVSPNNNSFVNAGYPAFTTGTAKGSWIAYSFSIDLGYEF